MSKPEPNTPKVDSWRETEPTAFNQFVATIDLREGMLVADVIEALQSLPDGLHLRLIDTLNESRWVLAVEQLPDAHGKFR